MVHLVVGHGEVGKALCSVLHTDIWLDRSKRTWKGDRVDVVHICIPYSEEFEKEVSYYKNNAFTIVHSTVPVGTCDKLGVVHSPIRGVHPNLEGGIRTFVKYFGGEGAQKAAKIFSDLGIRTQYFQKAKTTESIKLWDTTQYGRLIMLEKEIHDWCEKNDVDFNAVYTIANRDYNEGYTKLGMEHVVRPILKHMNGPIGGHCVLPNAKLLGVEL